MMGKDPDISIVYRALNEERWFAHSLRAVKAQKVNGLTTELVLVDSGSTDATLDIARQFGCRITHISKSKFSFGRSLNQGCDLALGKYLVFISAHCIPYGDHWLQKLLQPLIDGQASYCYGRQTGHEASHFSETQVFSKYFPAQSAIPQEGFFINNANSAIVRAVWEKFRFDEAVTGLEDMVLGKQLVENGYKLAYMADALITHIHEETFLQTRTRYYREALTLRDILPDIHMGFGDFFRYFGASVTHDIRVAREQGLKVPMADIIKFRFAQFWGSYQGHNEIKKLSRAQKERYYYPKPARGTGRDHGSPPTIISRSATKSSTLRARDN